MWYYHGRGRGAYRINADDAHETFEDYLNEIQLAPEVVVLYRELAKEMQANEAGRRAQRIRHARERIEKLEARLLQVDERFLDGDLERDSYRRLKDKYGRELAEARLILTERERNRAGLAAQIDFAVDMLGRLGQVWREASIEARDLLVGSI